MEKGPEERSSEVNAEIVNELLPLIMRWGNDSEDDREDYRDSLLAVLGDSFNDDGYRLAQDLDHKGWEVDAELVEILDNVSRLRHKWYQIQRSCWVQREGIVIPYSIGDLVRAPYRKPQYVVRLMPGTAEIGLNDEWSNDPTGAKRWTAHPVETVVLVESKKP